MTSISVQNLKQKSKERHVYVQLPRMCAGARSLNVVVADVTFTHRLLFLYQNLKQKSKKRHVYVQLPRMCAGARSLNVVVADVTSISV